MLIEPDAARDGTAAAGSTDTDVSGTLTEPLRFPMTPQELPHGIDESMQDSADALDDALFDSQMNTAEDFGSWDPPSLITLLFRDL